MTTENTPPSVGSVDALGCNLDRILKIDVPDIHPDLSILNLLPGDVHDNIFLPFLPSRDRRSYATTCQEIRTAAGRNGLWRSDLFLMNARINLDIENQQASWAKCRVASCNDVPDPRAAATPNAWNFRTSTLKSHRRGADEVSMDSDSNAVIEFYDCKFTQKVKGGDHVSYHETHTILIEDITDDITIAYSQGRNKFGHFISVGWAEKRLWFRRREGDKRKYYWTMKLARRYLVDSDPRAQWSIIELRSQVLSAGIPASCTVKEQSLGPWQCHVFRAKYQEECEGTNPSLHMSTPSGKPFTSELDVTKRRHSGATTIVNSRVIWEDQCWTCGGSGIRKEFQLWATESLAVRNVDFTAGQCMQADFCCQSCLLKFVPDLVKATVEWKELSSNSRPSYISGLSRGNGNGWSVIAASPNHRVMLEEEGWKYEERNNLASCDWYVQCVV